MLYGRMHELALEALPEFTKLHAGCATWHGKRLVVAGPGGSGKTTLVTRLLYEGFAVHCDDIVLLRRGEVLPYPRRFRIRTQALPLLPQLVPVAPRLAGARDHVALDPSELGFDWQIDAAPADVVLFLEPNHGGATRLEVSAKYSMAERIMSQSNLPAAGAGSWVRDVCSLVDGALCAVLRCGELEAMVGAVKESIANATTEPLRIGGR
jgi:hypothetical protein